MELIGRIKSRKICYVQIRNNATWKKFLPKRDWVAFTIANKEDEELLPPIVKACLDNNVSYTCSVGNYAQMTEAFFDEEIAWRGVDCEMKTKKDFDDDCSPNTTAHKNFGAGFWFAATLANADQFDIDKVVCIDFTRKKVKNYSSLTKTVADRGQSKIDRQKNPCLLDNCQAGGKSMNQVNHGSDIHGN